MSQHLKVKDLIERLQKQNPEKMVYLSSDPEGNMFRPMYENCIGGAYFDDKHEIYDHEEEKLIPNAIIIYPG